MPENTPTRRGFLGLLALTPVVAACATGGGAPVASAPAAAGPTSAANPLGVAAKDPLDVVIFKGGFGDDWAKFAESLYTKRHPGAKITHAGIQGVGQAMQPRMVAGDPPDVIDNSGAGALDVASLVADKQLLSLEKLLDAPSADDPAVKVRDTLVPGIVEAGSFGGVPYVLNYAYTVWGLWYSSSLFAKHGWTYPATWAEMLTLGDEIKKAGLAPWTYQGKYPEYMNDPLLTMVAKAGGMEQVAAIDNLEPGAWRAGSVKDVVEAFAELAGRGHIMKGSEALSHTEAQTAWCQGKAVFLPCGSWLEAEQAKVTPAGFDMVAGPTPRLSDGDKLPGTAIQAAGSEPFIVPAQGKNTAGGLEFLRLMLAKESAANFATTASAMPVRKDALEGLPLSSGLKSVGELVAAAGEHVLSYRFPGWYAPLAKAVHDSTGELLNGRVSAAQWTDRVQKAADQVAADASITKYER
ncbi:N-acetylglucosamine/diacetylchitobiose ABC transporter substrate-binding protein [Nonomuraea sp. NPDC059007]|uniref:N-acetylglucosamine/diacetylchitobiose ABC transporter substrate-binding protein n=1 Tax=Nonomuraea sp. NPDC059007 TaxID=3346692 RepID=UPI0036CBEEE8